MEQNKFFLIISRINSVLILLVAIAAIFSMAFIMGTSNDWGNRNAVQTKTDSDESENESIDLKLGSLEETVRVNLIWTVHRLVNMQFARTQRHSVSGS